MSTQFLEDTLINLHNYWPLISLLIILFLSIFSTILLLKKSPSPQKSGLSNTRQNLENVYNRIHNYQHERAAKAPTSTYSHQSNASTNSTYHHAIKLIQRGTDAKTLVEYCNLTYGEAELLQAVYGLKQ